MAWAFLASAVFLFCSSSAQAGRLSGGVSLSFRDLALFRLFEIQGCALRGLSRALGLPCGCTLFGCEGIACLEVCQPAEPGRFGFRLRSEKVSIFSSTPISNSVPGFPQP